MDFSTWTLPQNFWRELVADFDGDEQEAKNFYCDVVAMIDEVGFSRAVFVIIEELKIIGAMAQYRNMKGGDKNESCHDNGHVGG